MSDSAVPMKLCPREMSAEMAIAAMRTLPVPSSKTSELTVREIWQAAYDAAPAAPAISDSTPDDDLIWALSAVHGHEWALEHFREPRYKAAYEAGQLAILNAAPAAPGDAPADLLIDVSAEMVRLLCMRVCDEVDALSGWDGDPEDAEKRYKAGVSNTCEEIKHRIEHMDLAASLGAPK